jgi:N-alpha-acetyltransferase 50
MLQSSITAWLKKPASVKQDKSSELRDGSKNNSNKPAVETQAATELAPKENASTRTVAAKDAALATAFALKPLPVNVEFVLLTEELMPAFKRLNALLLPIGYPTVFYTETMTEPHHSLTLMALWHSTPLTDATSQETEKPRLVGAIRCRILPSSTLYIATIGLLSPYRSYGIATHLLNNIAVKASKEHGVKSITAHVWEANDDALEWYKKRGFEIIGKEDGYYRKLKPTRALLMKKWIGVRDLLAGENAPTTDST